MECARLPLKGLDEESAGWLRRLGADGGERQAAERELHARLVRIALAEVRRRSASTPVTGPELDDVAHQAAGDAMIAILAKLGGFRGESRFITWAYRFVILEVSSKLGRHYWRNPPVALDAGQWERLPDRFGVVAAGGNAAGRYPGVAAHLLACGPCSEDFAGLLLAVTGG
jgi:RNA polymerase sigma-70 factor (ECF subfamily)